MTDDAYSLKEIIDLTRKEQTEGFASVRTLLAMKADKSDVEGIRRDLEHHRERTDERLSSLEEDRKAREERARVHEQRDEREKERTRRRWSIRERVLTVAALTAAAAAAIIGIVH